ncbi:MAG: GGDEF domain-containing protein [Candidatus Margulisiibacteriota bacterium]
MVARIERQQINLAISRFFGVEIKKQRQTRVFNLLPSAVLCADGRINEQFLPHIAPRMVELFPETPRSAEELIGMLKAEGLTCAEFNFGGIYTGVIKERDAIGRLVDAHIKLRNINARLLSLQEFVQKLGLEPEQNRLIATKCIREALGFSGVRVYSVNSGEGTWHHRNSEGEEGVSRFSERRPSDPNSEKGFIIKLLRQEIPAADVARAASEGLYEWKFDGEWGFLHIPDRAKCDFVDKEQLRKDEEGDVAQGRNGYGSGGAREILYLVLNRRDRNEQEVFMITNWESRKPLFEEKKRDLELLHTFAKGVIGANDRAENHQKLKDISVHDELTGVHNRRYFNKHLEKEIARSLRYNHPLSLLMTDIDFFKKVNDTLGHQAGDYILRQVAQTIKEELRDKIDTVARYGGEEFAAILPETNGGGVSAREIAERVRLAVENKNFEYQGKSIKVTISIGVSTLVKDQDPNKPLTVGELIYRADQALYDAKEKGRNRVIVSSH